MIAYCGLDCSKCKSYIATLSGDHEELAKVAKNLEKTYRVEVKPEYVICDGCKTDKRHSYFCSTICKMRQCCIEQKYDSCIECPDFPCRELEFELSNTPEAKANLENLR